MPDAQTDDSSHQSRREPVAIVKASLTLFDWRLLATVRDEGDETGEATLTASGLFDPQRDWRYETHYQWESVEWRVPGPKGDVFGAFGRDNSYFDVSERPTKVSIGVDFREANDDWSGWVKTRLSRDGWKSQQVELADGSGSYAPIRWHGSTESAFPTLAGNRDDGSIKPEPETLLAAERDNTGTLPYVLALRPMSKLVLNADVMTSLGLQISRAQMTEISDCVRRGTQPIGTWSGTLCVSPDRTSILVFSGALILEYGVDAPIRAAKMREERLFSLLFREARVQKWTQGMRSPPALRGGHEPLHLAIRTAFSGLARQAAAEFWTWPQLREKAEQALSLVLSCRGAVNMDGVDASALSLSAAEAIARDERPPDRCWPLYKLGLFPLDPGAFHRWSHRWYTIPAHDLAASYLQSPSMWSDPVTLALAHGLLLSDGARELSEFVGSHRITQAFKPELSVGWWLFTRYEHDSYQELSDDRRRRAESSYEQERSAAHRRLLLSATAASLGWGVLGAMGAWLVRDAAGTTVLGAMLGIALGVSRRTNRRRELLETPIHLRVQKISQAIEMSSSSVVNWHALWRVMSEAAGLGAKWSPEAVQIVDHAHRRHGASRSDEKRL